MPRHRKPRKWPALTKPKWRELLALVMLVPWVFVDLMDTHNFAKLCLLAFSLIVAIGVSISFFRNPFKGVGLVLWLVSLVPISWTIWANTRPEPEPHVTVSMQIGDSPSARIVLTNQYLYRASVESFITNFPNGDSFFNGLPVGFIVVPMPPGRSNTVFQFIAKNDSPLIVAQLEMMVGFPADWKLGMDSDKWHHAELSLFGKGQELALTNLQGRIAAYPYVVYPGDWVNFPPITNFNSDIWHGPPTKIEHFRLIVKAVGFEQELAANIVFLPAPSNFFKPFLIPVALGTNGHLRPLISTNEMLREIENLTN